MSALPSQPPFLAQRRWSVRPASGGLVAIESAAADFHPAVPDDWHAKMWTVFKESLDKSAPGEFDVQINLNAALFKQGAEPAAMARGNLELTSISAFDICQAGARVLHLHGGLHGA